MRRISVRPEVAAPGCKDGSTIIVQPDEDLIATDEVSDAEEFSKGEVLSLVIPGEDGSTWESTGKVVSIDNDDVPLLLMVRVDWGSATLAS